MKFKNKCTKALQVLSLLSSFVLFSFAPAAQATVVQFKTSLGDFEVNLFDNTTPKTVANFLAYVESGAYTGTIVHRSIPGFIIQSGGFYYDIDSTEAKSIAANLPVMNEPVLSNVRGTISMAKLDSDANSATNQWFFNLANNSANLDRSNSGYTVFGVVMGNGMEILDQIAQLPRVPLARPFNDLPVQDLSATIDENNFIFIEAVNVVNTEVDTNLALLPPKNQAKNNAVSSGGSSGGSLAILSLLGLGLLLIARITKK